MNRVKVCVPEVMGGVFAWAYPKGQHGSISSGFKFLAPKVGDTVFVTFEFGDPTKPLWEYHGWGMSQIPQPLDGPNKMGIVTPEGNLIVIDDDNGELNLHFNGSVNVRSEKEIVINAEGDINVSSGDSVILNTGENGGVINIFSINRKTKSNYPRTRTTSQYVQFSCTLRCNYWTRFFRSNSNSSN